MTTDTTDRPLPAPYGAYALSEPAETGEPPVEIKPACDTCGGEGSVEEWYGGPHGDRFSRSAPCPQCDGGHADPDERTAEECESGRLPDGDTTGLREPAL